MSGSSAQRYTAVLGGAGFVGLAIVEQLLKAGEPVVVFDTIPLPQDAARLFETYGASCRAEKGSVCERADLAALSSKYPLKRIINCAALTPSPVQERQYPRDIFDVNLLAVINVLDEARAHRLPFIQVSSSGAFGEIQFREGLDAETISEDVLKDPISFYGISKYAAEQTALRYADLFGTSVLIARVGVVYGPWEYATGVRHIFSAQLQMLRHAMAGRPVVLERDSLKDFTYSRDVGLGLVALCAAKDLSSKVFHVSAGSAWTLSDFAAQLQRHIPGFTFSVAAGDQPPNVKLSRAKDRVPLDISRIRNETGFEPTFGLERAVQDYVEWARETSCWRA